MGLETATHIDELNESNPVGGDSLGQSDDHHRLIKKTIKNSFPKDLRGVSSPSMYQRLIYDGTSFKNYATGSYPWLRAAQNGSLNVGDAGIEYIAWDTASDVNNLGVTYANSNKNIELPGDFEIADIFVSAIFDWDTMANVTTSLVTHVMQLYLDTGSGFSGDDHYFQAIPFNKTDVTAAPAFGYTAAWRGVLVGSVDALRIGVQCANANGNAADCVMRNGLIIIEAKG